MKIMIVEDDRALNNGLALSLNTYDITQAFCLEEARKLFDGSVNLIVLDINLPDGDGVDFCREIRERSRVPIIFLTANDMEIDIVAGLESGADDYITKPFSMRELLARVRTNMRRAASMLPAQPGSDEDVLRARDLVIDRARRSVSRGGHELELTQREYELIKYLAENPGKVMSREELMAAVWQYDYFGDLRAVDVAVRRLREKIEDNPSEPQYVMTKRGAGYYFAD